MKTNCNKIINESIDKLTMPYILEQYFKDSKYQLQLLESTGEYVQFDKDVKEFFPSIWTNIKGNIQALFPVFAPRLSSEEKLLKQHIKNLDFEIRVNGSHSRNAWTIPFISDVLPAQVIMLIPRQIMHLIMFLVSYIGGPDISKILDKATFDPKSKVVTIPSGNKLRILIFVTKGTLTDLTPEERVAFYLHEIGHWQLVKTFSATAGIKQINIITALSIPVVGVIMILPLLVTAIGVIILSRFQEYKADSFSVESGFGEELKSAFTKIQKVRSQSTASIMVRISDFIIKLFLKVQNVIERLIPYGDHPSMEKRIGEIETKMEKMKKNKEVKSVFSKVDSLASKVLKKIKP